MSNTDAIPRDEFFDSLLGDFLDESGQLLDRLNENLLQLDEWVRSLDEGDHQSCDAELLNEMFRSAHSLKGLSAMLGLTDINTLTHKVENVFDAARKDELIVDGDCVEVVFQAVDRLGALVEVLKNPDAESVECDAVVEQIAAMLQSAGCERKQTSQADAERALQDTAEPAPEPPAAPVTPATPADAVEVAATETSAPDTSAVDIFAGLQDDIETASKYLSIFIDEAEMSLDQLTETLLAGEEEGGRQAVERLLVTSHRIKGSAASVGLNRGAKLAHLMEDALQTLQEEQRPLTSALTDSLLACTDGLRRYVDGLKHGESRVEGFCRLAEGLLQAQGSATSEAILAATETPAPIGADSNASPSAQAGTAGIAISEALREKVASLSSDQDATLVGRVLFERSLALVGLKAQLLREKLANLGELCYFDPPGEDLDELESLEGIAFGLVSENGIEVISRQLRVAGVSGLQVEALRQSKATAKVGADAKPAGLGAGAAASGGGAKAAAPVAKPKSGPAKEPVADNVAAKGRSAEAGSRPAETLRVDIERLDHLMNLAGQLVINKARFTQIGESLKKALIGKQSSHLLGNALSTLRKIASGTDDSHHGDMQAELEDVRTSARRVQTELEAVERELSRMGEIRLAANDLMETIHQLDRVTDGIQQSVMDTRMLPIGPLFTRFKRVIRDITRSNGKQIRLVINGEKTELDKRMIDELGDPLIHMVRNSADHGVEMPDEREAAGKPREGTVTLNAFHRGNSIVIEVIDDGKGLDAERIRRKAVEKGMLTEADAERMTRHQLYQMIWEPGLSTAQKVTEVSGRGMGMDIVKSKIEDLNGTVEVQSEPGQGTTMTIKLPLTLAILPSLMVDIDNDVFAMPLESVVEIVSVGAQDTMTVYGQWTARVRGRVISLVRLDDLLSFHGASRTQTLGANEEATLVIVSEGGREIGLAVSRVLGEEDIVIKSMAENYRNVPGIAGASILGDGRVSLILDLAALIDMCAGSKTAPVG